MSPSVSIVLPSFNSEKTIRKSIESVLTQSFKDWELIIVDDFSKDNTIEVVKEYQKRDSRIKLILNDENWGGPAKPRNQGIVSALGQYIAFLDADDWWYNNKLEICIPYLSSFDVVYHHLDFFVGEGHTAGKIKGRKLEERVIANLLKNLNSIPNSSAIVKKQLIEQVGGISEDKDLIAVEDLDLWVRVSEVTEKYYCVDQTLGAYWFGGGNITELSEKQMQRLNNLYRKHVDKLSEKDKLEAYYILEYSCGRIREKMGQKKIAISHFKKSLNRQKLEIKLKSLYLIIILSIKLIFERDYK